jgi:hypothetical protein
MSEKSEFGRGLVVCLVKFAEHFENDGCAAIYDAENKKRNILKKETEEETVSHMIELWARGASDHLYEIQTPESWTYHPTELTILITSKLKELQEKGLAMRSSYNTSTLWKKEDVNYLFKLTKEIAILLDKQLGIYNADLGQW